MATFKKNTVLLVFFLTLMVCVFGYSGVAQTNATDAKVVMHAKGIFRDRGNKQWQESGVSGKNVFNFVETSRNASAVFLLDSSRNVRIELNVTEQMIYYSDSKTTRAALYPIVNYLTVNTGNLYRIRIEGKCLQAVELEGGVFSPELMSCTLSTSQQWNILERNFNGVTSYRLRSVLTQIRRPELCLTGKNVNQTVTLNRCDTSDAQRWVNLRLNTSTTFTDVRTLAVSNNICLGTRYSTQGAPRFRLDEDGNVTQDVEFTTLFMPYCEERPTSGTNNARWGIQLL